VPGLGIPKYADTRKDQRIVEQKVGKKVTIVVREVNVISGVPYSDRFEVVCTWVATWEGPGEPLRLVVSQEIMIKKPFMLEKTVEKNSATETKETLQVWIKQADSLLHISPSQNDHKPSDSNSIIQTSKLRNLLQSIWSNHITVKVVFCTFAAALIISSQVLIKTRTMV